MRIVALSTPDVARFPAAVAEVDDAAVDVAVIGVTGVVEPAQMTRHARLLITWHPHVIIRPPARGLHQRDVAHGACYHGMRGSGERRYWDAGEADDDRHDRRNDEEAHDWLLVKVALLFCH